MLWGTTPLFLEKLVISAIGDLPTIASFVPDAALVEALEKTLSLDGSAATDDGDSGP